MLAPGAGHHRRPLRASRGRGLGERRRRGGELLPASSLRGSSVDVVVHEGASTSVAVTGDPSVRERLKTRIAGDTLFVDLDPKSCFGICVQVGDDDAKVDVALPALRAATIEGSGDLVVTGNGAHAELDLNVEGSGDVRYAGNVDVLRCKIDGSGDVVLHGAGKRLETLIHGSGDVNARDFPVAGGLYFPDLEGSGDVITVVHGGDMSVRLHGSGDLVYSGDFRITSLDVSGSGEMREHAAADGDGDSDSDSDSKE